MLTTATWENEVLEVSVFQLSRWSEFRPRTDLLADPCFGQCRVAAFDLAFVHPNRCCTYLHRQGCSGRSRSVVQKIPGMYCLSRSRGLLSLIGTGH